jgi:hypothetical protein
MHDVHASASGTEARRAPGEIVLAPLRLARVIRHRITGV